MSHWASAWAYEQDIDQCGQKFVLVALANFADEQGFCYPSQDTLAAMTGQGVRTVQRHLKDLTIAGFIKRAHRHRGGKRTSDGYTICAPAERLKPNPPNRRVVNPPNRHDAKLSPDLSDHKVDPSVKKDPPLPPKGNGYRQPVKPPEEKFELPPDPFPMTNDLNVWLAEMCFSFSQRELAEATQAWRESRESKPDRRKRTMGMWQADWKKFIRAYWEIRQRNGNKRGRDDEYAGGNPPWMAPEKPVDYFEKINAQYRGK